MIITNPVLTLFLLAIPIACISWTVTHEEVCREIREYCAARSKSNKSFLGRKFFYLFTCEYCFSHYVTILFLVITEYKLLMDDWSGYVIAGFSLVWVANIYMSLFGLIRSDMKKVKEEISILEEKNDLKEKNTDEEKPVMNIKSRVR